jgi:hypothetical protein
MLRGKSGEIMRICLCRFIECVSIVQLPLNDHYDSYLSILEESFKSN